MKKTDPSVFVIMSTFNGERYLEEQIESILNQEDVDVEILIRDDGSSDSTIRILESYSENSKVRFYQGKNLKPSQSFMHLIYSCPDTKDYYAFSDQDDIWESQKLRIATTELKHEKGPALFYSGLQRIDEAGNKIGAPSVCSIEKARSFQAIIESFATTQGCTMVFNKELLKYLKQCLGAVDMHDSFTNALCVALGGNVICSDMPLVKYRMHSMQVTGKETHKVRQVVNRFVKPNKLRLKTVQTIDEYENIVEDCKTMLMQVKAYTRLQNKLAIMNWNRPEGLSKKDHLLFKMRIFLNKY